MNDLTPRRGGISPGIRKAIALTLLVFAICLIAAVYRAERVRPLVAESVAAVEGTTDPVSSSRDQKSVIESRRDPLAEISSDTCHEVFVAYHQVRVNAEDSAEAIYPLSKAPGDPESLKLYHSRRDALIEATEESGRQTLLNRYGITAETLEAIDNEGLTREWSYLLPETVEQDATRGLVIKRRGGARSRSGGGGRRR